MEFIASKVSDQYLYLIASKKTAADMWKAIIDSFTKSSSERLVVLREKLFQMKYAKGEPIEEYVRNFRKCVDQMSNLGDKLSQDDYMWQFLNSLTSDFLPITVMLDDELGNILWDRLQSKVLVFGDKLVYKSDEKKSGLKEEETGKSSATVFNVRFRGNCYNCDKPEHSAKYCRSKKRSEKLYESYGKNLTHENSNNGGIG